MTEDERIKFLELHEYQTKKDLIPIGQFSLNVTDLMMK